jgi:hypothetical protein
MADSTEKRIREIHASQKRTVQAGRKSISAMLI